VADESIQPNDELGAEVVSGAETAGPSMKVAIIGISLVVMVVAIAVGFGFLDLRQPRQYRIRGALFNVRKNTADLTISESIDVEGQIGTAQESANVISGPTPVLPRSSIEAR